jgi:hypothetical protein
MNHHDALVESSRPGRGLGDLSLDSFLISFAIESKESLFSKGANIIAQG